MADRDSGDGASEPSPPASTIRVNVSADRMSAEVTLESGDQKARIEVAAVLQRSQMRGVHGVRKTP